MVADGIEVHDPHQFAVLDDEVRVGIRVKEPRGQFRDAIPHIAHQHHLAVSVQPTRDQSVEVGEACCESSSPHKPAELDAAITGVSVVADIVGTPAHREVNLFLLRSGNDVLARRVI